MFELPLQLTDADMMCAKSKMIDFQGICKIRTVMTVASALFCEGPQGRALVWPVYSPTYREVGGELRCKFRWKEFGHPAGDQPPRSRWLWVSLISAGLRAPFAGGQVQLSFCGMKHSAQWVDDSLAFLCSCDTDSR